MCQLTRTAIRNAPDSITVANPLVRRLIYQM